MKQAMGIRKHPEKFQDSASATTHDIQIQLH